MNCLKLTNLLAERLPFLRVFHRRVQTGLRYADSLSRYANSASVERVHGNLEARSLFTQHL